MSRYCENGWVSCNVKTELINPACQFYQCMEQSCNISNGIELDEVDVVEE